MNSRIFRLTPFEGLVVILGFVLVSTANSLRANSWQKRIDRAFLQVDGVTPQGRFRCFQRALKDPELRTDVSKAIDVVREKGFGKGHPEFIELLWPQGTQARRDLEAINALTKQLSERSSEVQDNSSDSQGLLDIIRSTQENLRFGEEGSLAVVSSLLEGVQSDPSSIQRLAGNFFRNAPAEVESPSYKLLGQYSDEMKVVSESDKGEETNNQKKSFLTIPALEIRQYDAFRSVSVPLRTPGSSSSLDNIYTLKNMGSALTEIFSFLELGNNARSTLIPMTTPFFISDTTTDGANKMFVKLPQDQEANPPNPIGSSRVAFDDVPETVIATLSFPGICTNKEIERQKSKLMERIESTGDTGWKIRRQQIRDTKSDDRENEDTEEDSKEENEPEIFVLQYNAPGTLPWRRMNEIAVVMEKTSLLSDKDELVAEAEMESDQKDTEGIKDSDKDEIVAEAEIESDQKDSEVIKDSEEINGSDADDSNDENASTTYPDVD
jgi:hypothetical protein